MDDVGNSADRLEEDRLELAHVRAVASERARAARDWYEWGVGAGVPGAELSAALEEESYWWGVWDRGYFDESD